MLARLMKPGAELRLATDDPSYLPWMIEHAAPIRPSNGWPNGRPTGAPVPPTGRRPATSRRRSPGTPTFLRFGVYHCTQASAGTSVARTEQHQIAAATCSTRQAISEVR